MHLSGSKKAMKQLITILCSLLIAGSAFAGSAKSYRVHYTIHGSGKDIIVQADSSDDARRTVEDMFPDGYVTGVKQIGR